MLPEAYKKFEEIFRENKIRGRVLEVGAMPSSISLLASECLGDCEKIGLNLKGPGEFKDFRIIKGNANNMAMFRDGEFDCVLCNAVLEHDKYFWKSLSEMKRVLKSGGLLVIGTPSFHRHRLLGRLVKIAKKIWVPSFLERSAVCFKIHNEPGDYYRYSEQAFREVFFGGFDNVEIRTIMLPPVTIGFGFKK